MTTSATRPGSDDATAVNLGLRMRRARQAAGLTLRELARRLSVSPSFLSQIENGKSQPSVVTLYSVAQVLGVSIDHLFEPTTIMEASNGHEEAPDGQGPDAGADEASSVAGVLRRAADLRDMSSRSEPGPVSRSDLGPLEHVWHESGNHARLSVTTPGGRTRLVMDTGVIWEQLATNTVHQIDFIEILYPPGSTSTSDDRMLRHVGFEYGYLLEGELEVTFGFDTFVLHAGEALGLDSSVPHLFRNRGDVTARGIWFVHHDHD